jgi:ribosome-associated translation inhibitor RaiA
MDRISSGNIFRRSRKKISASFFGVTEETLNKATGIQTPIIALLCDVTWKPILTNNIEVNINNDGGPIKSSKRRGDIYRALILLARALNIHWAQLIAPLHG